MLDFEELDFTPTPLGDLSLRRRAEVRLGDRDVFEVKLGDEFLMSSLFTAGETALAQRALTEHGGHGLDVVVGGLGLGYTAVAALAHAATASVLVVELMAPVIRWHREHLVPMGATLTADSRCRLLCGDFFAICASAEEGFDPAAPGRRFDVMLLDIDHSPRHWLSDANRAFYSTSGLTAAKSHLAPGGVFALWSNDVPDDVFLSLLKSVFFAAAAQVVTFDNPYTGGTAASTIYVARALTPF